MVKTGAWHSHAWRQQCDDCSYGAVSFAGCRTSGKDHGQQNVFEHPMLSGGVSGGSGVYEKCGSDLHYFSYGTDDFGGDQLLRVSVPGKLMYLHRSSFYCHRFKCGWKL